MTDKAVEIAHEVFWEEWEKPDTNNFLDCMRAAIAANEREKKEERQLVERRILGEKK